MSVDFEAEALFVAGGVDHERSSVGDEFDDPLPHEVANAWGDVAYEHTGTDFEEPSGEVSSKTRGYGSEYDDGQNSSP